MTPQHRPSKMNGRSWFMESAAAATRSTLSRQSGLTLTSPLLVPGLLILDLIGRSQSRVQVIQSAIDFRGLDGLFVRTVASIGRPIAARLLLDELEHGVFLSGRLSLDDAIDRDLVVLHELLDFHLV